MNLELSDTRVYEPVTRVKKKKGRGTHVHVFGEEALVPLGVPLHGGRGRDDKEREANRHAEVPHLCV